MYLSIPKPASYRLPAVSGECVSHSKVVNVEMVKNSALPFLQAAKKEGDPLLQETFRATSRRETMHLAAASLGFLSLLLPEYAEARTRNAENRRKILEKLEKRREKAGLSMPKVEGQGKNRKDEAEAKEKKSNPKAGSEEKNTKPIEESEGKKSTPHQSKDPLSDGALHLPLPSLLTSKMMETKVS